MKATEIGNSPAIDRVIGLKTPPNPICFPFRRLLLLQLQSMGHVIIVLTSRVGFSDLTVCKEKHRLGGYIPVELFTIF